MSEKLSSSTNETDDSALAPEWQNIGDEISGDSEVQNGREEKEIDIDLLTGKMFGHLSSYGIDSLVSNIESGNFSKDNIPDEAVQEATQNMLELLCSSTNHNESIGKASGFIGGDISNIDRARIIIDYGINYSDVPFSEASFDKISSEYQARREYILNPDEKCDKKMQKFIEDTFSPEDCQKIFDMIFDLKTEEFTNTLFSIITEKFGLKDYGVSLEIDDSAPRVQNGRIDLGEYSGHLHKVILHESRDIYKNDSTPEDLLDSKTNMAVLETLAHELFHARQHMISEDGTGSDDNKNYELNFLYYQDKDRYGVEAYKKQLVEREAFYFEDNIVTFIKNNRLDAINSN